MNHNLHRIVFNKNRGQLMAVAETASGHGKAASGEHGAAGTPGGPTGTALPGFLFATLRSVCLGVFASLGMVFLTAGGAGAQIIADRTAPGNQQPTVLGAGNGVPVVNIQTPSAAGVSRNTYSQFDVNANGAILNNSRSNVQTQLGGYVQGNPWLATGPARVILNEVNSASPSHLRGYTEVAGQRAEVVIANPAGINIDGAGFINASRVTLTTGAPIVNGGSLDGYRVERGSIAIGGAGLDASQADYTGILARAVQVNAGIWAKELRVVTGANQIDTTQTGVVAVAGTGAVPTFALDVAQLGGMYAGKIMLIGTEAGVGVSNAGVIGASAGEVEISAEGLLTNRGRIQASSDLSITATGGVLNSGGEGVIVSQGKVTIDSGVQFTNETGALVAASGSLNISTSGQLLNSQSTLAANGAVVLDAASLSNASGTIASIEGGVRIATSGVTSNTLTSNGLQGGRITAAGDVSITSGGLVNTASTIAGQRIAIDTRGQTLDNTAGTLFAGAGLQISSGELVNTAGLIQAVGDLTIDTLGKTLTNTQASAHASGAGGIVAQGAATLATGDLNNSAGYVGSAGAMRLAGARIDNSAGGKIIVENDLHLTATGVNNQSGEIQTSGNLQIALGLNTFNNTAGLLRSSQTLSLVADSVTNSGTSAANQGIEANNITLAARSLANDNGSLRASTDVTLTSSGLIDNAAGLVSAGRSLLVRDAGSVRSLLVRDAGSVRSLLVRDAGSVRSLLVVNTGGTLIADQSATLEAARIGGDGRILSQGDLQLASNSDFSNTGQVIGNGNVGVSTAGTLSNSGQMQAGQSLHVQANHIVNAATGEISATNTTLTAADTLTNRGVIDGIATRINATTLSNIGTGRIYGDHVAISAVTLNNDTETVAGVRADAVIAARQRLDIGVQTLNNRNHALIFSAGTGANTLNIGGSLDANGFATGQASAVNNHGATIESLGDLNISTARLSNTNANYTTTVVQTAGPTSLLYIQPEGTSAKLLAENFVWESFSRAGQYRYLTSPPVNSSGVLGQSPVPRVGEQSCTGVDPNEVCTRVPGADYLADNPAWAYFAVAAPTAAPAQPTLAVPTPPDPARAGACQAGPTFNASACTAYNSDLAAYNTAQANYDSAWASYNAAQAAWQADTDAKYTQLDAQIETYNNTFAGTLVRNWTQFAVTHTESQTQVTSSDPGQILAGRNMTLTGGNLVNDKSRIIAGGVLGGDLANLRSVAAEGLHTVHEDGTSQYTYSRWRGGLKRYHERVWDPLLAYTPADVITTFDLPVTQTLAYANFAGSAVRAAAHLAADSG